MWQIHQMMQGLFGSLVQGILYSMVSYGLQESMTKTVSWRLSTVYWSWLTLVTGSFIQMYSPNIGTALKGSLEACITKLLYLNWIAGFRAWRVKDNRSRASLAGCQWTMQSRPQLSAAGRTHAEVHIRRDSLCCFDGSVIAAGVCPQLEFRYSPPITCYYSMIGSYSVFSIFFIYFFAHIMMCLEDSVASLIILLLRHPVSDLISSPLKLVFTQF